MKKNMTLASRRVLVGVVGVVALLGFVAYEVYSIMTKEYARQSEIAAETREEIGLGLDMVKIAVQTDDVDMYSENLNTVRERLMRVKSLFLVHDEQAEYLVKLGEYVGVLDAKVDVLAEMRDLKEKVADIEGALREKYGNKDEISREKVKEAEDEIAELKIDAGQYSSEKVVAVANAVNEMLDEMADKAGELAGCIDNCYKDKIKKIDDELAEVFKEFADRAPMLNSELEGEFGFGEMGEVRALN